MIRRVVNLIAARHIQEMFRRVILARWEQEAIDCIEHTDEGCVIWLKPGYANSRAGSHLFVAATHRDAVNAFRTSVVPCGCPDCDAQLAQAWSMDVGGAT